MGAKISAEMKKARKLVEAGMTAYAAAKLAGISQGAISKAPWRKAMLAEKRKPPP